MRIYRLRRASAKSQITYQNVAIFPNLTWNPQRPSAARFDNMTATDTYISTPF